eukprot:Skav201266  [mRNA]  locus=scaffold1810:12507:24590:+ [translate_table: standard]
MPEESDKSNAGVGLIYPPPDIRGVIDKTAQFVAKCGEGFEQRVLREQNHTKFAFLLPNNPYRPYYEHKVREFKTGVVEETKPEVPQAIIDQKAKEDEKKKKKEQLKALTMGEKKKKQVKPPPADQYVVNHPYIAPMDTDIIKLTAQFVARNGQKFLIGLTQRESRNPQFDFLKPTHALFGYFTSLVDAYTKCLMPNKDEVEKLKKCINNPQEVVDKAMARFHWDEQEEANRVSREEEQKEEKEQMAQIDWHDFVVVETIEFTAEDDSLQLAPPIDPATHAPKGAPAPLEQAGTMFAEAKIEKPKAEEEVQEESAAPNVDEKEKEEREKRERELAEQREMREREEREREEREREEERERQEREADEMIEEEPLDMEPEIPLPMQEPEMKVRKDYVRQKKGSAQRLMQRCPITGQLIAAEEMSNHLKVLLLDPKWKHQKDALVERARKESAFADDVEANLASFVAKRPDLFGTVEEEIREAAEAGAEAAARDAGADAGPAHTMVPPTAPEALAAPKKAALPGAATGAALQGPGMQALPAGQQGPIAGVSTINARLPQASLANQGASAASGVKPPGMLPGTGPMALADDDDEDDEPMAKKPRLDDGSLFPEETWVNKHPTAITIIVQTSLGADGLAAGIAPSLPMEVSVQTKVHELKAKLQPKVANAGLNVANMKLKVLNSYILKNAHSLAFYNIGPGCIIELTRKTRGGK